MIKAVVFDYGAVINRRLRLQRPLLELAAQLRGQGIRTAILSNMIAPISWGVKRRSHVKDFDPAVFSSDIGVRKPDLKSYEFVIEKLGLKPEECLFVDNRSDNIAAAKAVGMATVQDKTTAQTIVDIMKLLGI